MTDIQPETAADGNENFTIDDHEEEEEAAAQQLPNQPRSPPAAAFNATE